MASEPKPESSLERLASEPEPGLTSEFLDFLAHNKKWWLLPILLMLGLAGALAALAATGAAPFLYTLF